MLLISIIKNVLVCNSSTFAVRFTFLSGVVNSVQPIRLDKTYVYYFEKFCEGGHTNNYISKADGYQTSDLLL